MSRRRGSSPAVESVSLETIQISEVGTMCASGGSGAVEQQVIDLRSDTFGRSGQYQRLIELAS